MLKRDLSTEALKSLLLKFETPSKGQTENQVCVCGELPDDNWQKYNLGDVWRFPTTEYMYLLSEGVINVYMIVISSQVTRRYHSPILYSADLDLVIIDSLT